MRKQEGLAAAVLLAVSAWGIYEAYWIIGFGSFSAPGPGFFPFWLAVALFAMAAYYLAVASGCVSKGLWEDKSWHRPVLAGAVMIGYALLFDTLGFCGSTLLLFLAWQRLIEKEGWQKSVCVSLVGTAGSYALFALLLEVNLPRGLWM